jgi:peptide/nickel transport system substrate-binding protein
MQSNLEQIGFKVTQEGNPWNRVTDLATKVDTTPAVNQVYFGPTYPSPDSMFYTQYHSKAAGTWASMEWLQNPEIDKLIDQARATSDENRQIEIYKELQHKIVDLQPDVFVLTMTAQLAIDKCLDGYKYVPMQSVSYSFSRYSWTCKQK